MPHDHQEPQELKLTIDFNINLRIRDQNEDVIDLVLDKLDNINRKLNKLMATDAQMKDVLVQINDKVDKVNQELDDYTSEADGLRAQVVQLTDALAAKEDTPQEQIDLGNAILAKLDAMDAKRPDPVVIPDIPTDVGSGEDAGSGTGDAGSGVDAGGQPIEDAGDPAQSGDAGDVGSEADPQAQVNAAARRGR